MLQHMYMYTYTCLYTFECSFGMQLAYNARLNTSAGCVYPPQLIVPHPSSYSTVMDFPRPKVLAQYDNQPILILCVTFPSKWGEYFVFSRLTILFSL